MVMLRPKGKAKKVATAVMKNKGVKVDKTKKMEKTTLTGPYLQH
jgi:hypothetical protein